MKILFLHPNMPGQYKHICKKMAEDPKNTVVFISKPRKLEIPGVHKLEYQVMREASPSTHRYLRNAESAVLQGQEVWRMCKKLKEEEGFVPDVICAHPGWGDALFIKDIFPNTPLLSFLEFYYRAEGADVGFNPAEPVGPDDYARVRMKNTVNILSLESTDWGICPTWWQQQVHPEEFKSKISVIHDGIDTDIACPNPEATVTLPGDIVMTGKDELITYVARNFEPYRGFDTVMRAFKTLLERRPNCRIVAVGADGVSYGKKAPDGQTYRQMLMKELGLDSSRLHFVGLLDYKKMIRLMQASSAHIYFTYPFVLSWSMMEAMACGCPMICSDTAPVREVMQDGYNGLLCDFFSPEQLAERVEEALDNRDKMAVLRQNARETILQRYALNKLLPLHLSLIKDIARGEMPPSTAERIAALHTDYKLAA